MVSNAPTISIGMGNIRIRFDSSTKKNSPIIFKPQMKIQNVKIGENSLAFYKAKNKTDEATT